MSESTLTASSSDLEKIQQTLTQEQLIGLREDAENNFYFFAKFILGFDWLVPEIHKPLCDILQNYEVHTRVKVTLPRSWLKSTVCSIAYPIWRAVRDPNIRVLIVQNTAANAKAKLRSIRGLWESNSWLRLLWAHLLPTADCRWTTDSLELTRTKRSPEGTFDAIGLATQVVGRHYNIIIEDDTVAPDKDEYTEDNVLPTKDDIGQAIGWHRAATPLLVDMSTDMIIVVGTRWFELDLLSYIEERETWYISYERAVRELNGRPDPSGVIVWEKRFGEKMLEQLEASMGPYLFSCLYLNHPLRSEDMVFQPQWFQYYDSEPSRNFKTVTTVDPAGNPKNSVAKNKRKNDYNTILTTRKHLPSGRVYIVNYRRFKGSPGDLIEQLFEEVIVYKPEIVGIEGIAYQESLEYFVTEEMRRRKTHFNIELIKHGGRTKEFRIRALQPVVKAGTLLFKGWMRELITELEVFPLGKNDDLADVLAMQLPLWDITPVQEETEVVDTEDPRDLTTILKSIARHHRPLTGSVMDVYNKPIADAKEPDPYQYLWEKPESNN